MIPYRIFSNDGLLLEISYNMYNKYKGRFINSNLPPIYGDSINEVLELFDEISYNYNNWRNNNESQS